MGKRKKSSRTPQGPKKREPLPTQFKCVFCNSENTVSVTIDKKIGIGSLSCKACHQSFQTTVTYLAAPVDVYADWIDACDAVANDPNAAAAVDEPLSGPRILHKGRAGLAPGEQMTAEDEAFIENDEEDAEAAYADSDDD